ncbi:MAG: S8 family serine peptidase [Candidatus Poseidoniaceae archaeon]|jgi:hypothetical protein|nr:S8 family serine peptidase [Candidatus Poseidoniaceae archaeon]
MRSILLALLMISSAASPALSWGESSPEGDVINLSNGNVVADAIENIPMMTHEGYFILTHDYPVPSEWLHELESSGINCWSFLPPAAFHCELTGQNTLQLEDLDVSSMIQMPPESKLHPDLIPSLKGEMDSWFITKDYGFVKLVLSGDNLPEGIEERNDVSIFSHNWRWATVEVRISGVEWLIQQSEVEWIEPLYEKVILNDVADDIVDATVLRNATQVAGINPAWNALDGTGIIVAVSDTGLDNGVNDSNMHPDIRDHIVDIHSFGIPPSSQSWANAPYNDGASDLDSGHGTHVAGSVLGDGTQSSGQIMGMAPEARLYMQATQVYTDWTTSVENTFGYIDDYTLMGIPDDLSYMFDAAAANGSHIHTNSWGAPAAGQYTTNSMQTDYSARNHSGMLILFSAGNSGVDSDNDGEINWDSIGAPATSKNVLTVGASENNRPSISSAWGGWWPVSFPSNPINSDPMANNSEGLAAFSSRGPTDDGRLKPDLSAPGTFILSTKSRSTTSQGWGSYSNSDYVYMGGTSMSTPITAGASALIYQHLIDNLGYSDPSSALVKGILTSSARDMNGQYGSSTNGAGETAPNNHEGWGLLDLSQALNTSWVDDESVNTGDSRSWKFTVPSSAPDLKIMVSWTDAPSTPSAATNLVNDIDFAVKDPNGNWAEYGNNLDNLIGTTISAPMAGVWEVHVNGTNIPTGPQKFAMILDSPYSMTNMSADADGDGFIDTLDDCPTTAGTSTQDQTGCPDGDGDGWSNVGDDFPNEVTQWSDSDGDGFGDNPGGINPDSCTSVIGTSSNDRYGCPDSDSDSWSDPDGSWTEIDGADACDSVWGNSTLDRNGCLDNDGDGQSNINDVLENDSSQWLDTDSDGYFDNANPATNWDDCPTTWGNSTSPVQGCLDTDGDGVADSDDGWPNDPTKSTDTDGDGIADSGDDCPFDAGNSTWILIGCPDADGDGRTVEYDAFPSDGTQWNDTDGDGYGDNPSGTLADDCPNTAGDSWQNGTLGCPDTDGDGWADSEDSYADDITQWHDIDGDGYGDNSGGTNPDACPEVAGNSTEGGALGCPDTDGDGWADLIDALPNDPTQWLDSDGDGYGDNSAGNQPDACTNSYGNSTIDRYGCLDSDGDGYSDLNDDFPSDPTRWIDSDGDGYDDLEDDCVNQSGTSTNGSLGCFDADQDSWADSNDSFPLENSQWNDTDGDGYGDNNPGFESDSCPTLAGTSTEDRFGCIDADGDGWSDSGDLFPSDNSEWNDTDGDGFGNNQDACPSQSGNSTNGSIGCSDTDGDGWSDDHDIMPNDPSQWSDVDGDGFGDNTDGTNGDDCPQTFGTSTIDQNGCLDGDEDGWSDSGDLFPDHDSQWNDTDGDGFGDNNAPGSELADHWPEDPGRNVAEVILTCSETNFEIDIATDNSIAFTCSVQNEILYPLTVRVEWKTINSIDVGARTHVINLDGSENKMVPFAGNVVNTGEHTIVIEASEPGAASSMSITSIPVHAINSNETGTLQDIEDSILSIPHLQEIIACAVAIFLLISLIISSRKASLKRKQNREMAINQIRNDRFNFDPANRFGRMPPPN